MQIISTFCSGNVQQKALIINITLRLRMSANAYAYLKVWTSPNQQNKQFVMLEEYLKKFSF